MKPYDKLICIFEDAGMNVKKHINDKRSSTFTKGRMKFLNGTEVRKKFNTSNITTKKYKTYKQLCEAEQSIFDIESDYLSEFPNNPFWFKIIDTKHRVKYVEDLICKNDNGKNIKLQQLPSFKALSKERTKQLYLNLIDGWKEKAINNISTNIAKLTENIEHQYLKDSRNFKKKKASVFKILFYLMFGALTLYIGMNNQSIFVIISLLSFIQMYLLILIREKNKLSLDSINKEAEEMKKLVELDSNKMKKYINRGKYKKLSLSLFTNIYVKYHDLRSFYTIRNGKSNFLKKYNLIKGYSNFVFLLMISILIYLLYKSSGVNY